MVYQRLFSVPVLDRVPKGVEEAVTDLAQILEETPEGEEGFLEVHSAHIFSFPFTFSLHTKVSNSLTYKVKLVSPKKYSIFHRSETLRFRFLGGN